MIAWTGHRPDLFADTGVARATVDSAALEISRQPEVTRFVVGGQRGVDTWAALAAQRLRIPYRLILPLAIEPFTAGWSSDDRAILDDTLAAAQEVEIVGGEAGRAYTERNRRLATVANLVIAVWTGVPGGGTAETIAFARVAGTPVREFVLEASAQALSAGGRGI